MKKQNLKSVMLVLVLVLMGCQVYAQGTEELKAKIIKINKEMQQAMVSGNSTAGMAYYTADAVSMPNYGKMAMGIEAIKKSNEEMMSSGMKITTFETNTLKVEAGGNLVTEVGTYKMSFTMSGAAGEMSDTGKYLTVWEKQGDG